tara:strand:- start:918 stop:1469 length:552 start_codon:yes stop_codon:yes gene_type:complete
MADVKQTITDFYRVAQDRDFSRDFQFRVLSIQPGDGSDVTITEDDLVYARGGSIPERTISNQTVGYMGLNFNVPGAATYSGTYPLTFMCDSASALRRVFEKWSYDIFDDENSTGNYFTPRATSTVDLVQLNSQLDAIAHYQLVGVYPTSVGEISYTIEGSGAPVTFATTLSYHFWKRIKPEKD